MRTPKELTREELEEVVRRVQEALWGVDEHDEVTLDPDRGWDAGTVEEVGAVLANFGLRPDGDNGGSWWVVHYTCPDCGEDWEEEWDCPCDSECGKCGCRDITPDGEKQVR